MRNKTLLSVRQPDGKLLGYPSGSWTASYVSYSSGTIIHLLKVVAICRESQRIQIILFVGNRPWRIKKLIRHESSPTNTIILLVENPDEQKYFNFIRRESSKIKQKYFWWGSNLDRSHLEVYWPTLQTTQLGHNNTHNSMVLIIGIENAGLT